MKLKNVLLSFITVVACLFVGTVKADVTAPDSYMVNGADTYRIKISNFFKQANINSYNFHYKVNADGHVIYCVQSHDYAVTSGTQKYTLSKEMEAKYAYVLANGYPNKSITGDKDKDYFITSFAVFYLINPKDALLQGFDLENGTIDGNPSDIVKEIAKLVNGANNYVYVEPSISIKVNNNFVLSSDKMYYVSSNNGVSVTGIVGDYTVSLENALNGIVITDINDTEKNTFKSNEKFLIKIPVSSINGLSAEFKVNVNATGSINKAYLYKPEQSKYQNTIALYPENNNVNDSAPVKLNLTTEVQISKIDATTSEELPGAKLIVKDSTGKVVDTWTSTNEVHVIKNLKPGKYTLTEEIAPEGYILSTETVEFEVKLDGTVTKVVMENMPAEKNPIYISKKDITTGEELAGAHLELKDEEGNLIEAWVSANESHMIEELKAGKYFLTETLAPEGYELSTETVEFVVKADGAVDGDIVMYNKPETIIEVPSTSSFKTITSSLIGIIVIGLGSMIIYRNYKKNEEF